MKKNTLIIASLFVPIILLLSACTPDSRSESTTTTPPLDTESANIVNSSYPYPDQDKLEAYPSSLPESDNNSLPAKITPDPNLASVKGTLLYNGKPVSGTLLYLSEIIYGSNGKKWVRFNRLSNNRTSTDKQGNFIFYNIPPGEYGLVLDTIVNSYLLSRPSGSEIVIELEKGDQINLGVLDYADLPIPSP